MAQIDSGRRICTELPPVERAVVDVSAKLTNDPEALTGADLCSLRALGFTDLQILDILNPRGVSLRTRID
ncbi:MAG: hypothetical protein R2855_10695 [Thermomicrobiales bacterium]